MTANIVPLNQALKSIASTSNSPALRTDETGVYRINGGDELLVKIENVIDYLDNVELTEDDRDMVRDTRRFTNEFIKAVDRAVIDERARVFDPVNEERKAINERMTVMKRILADKLDQFDQRIRAEKREELQAHFNDEKTMGEYAYLLQNVSFEMLENQSWSNRSSSLPKAKQELSERVKSLASAVSIADENDDVPSVVGLLIESDWSLPDVIVRIQQRNQERLQEQREKEQRAREIAEAERRGREQALAEMDKTAQRSGATETEPQEVAERIITVAVKGTDEHVENVRVLLANALNECSYDVEVGVRGHDFTVTIGTTSD